MRALAFVPAVVLAVGFGAGSADAQQSRYGQQKAVYHINYDGEEGQRKYKAALQNVKNHLSAVGADNMKISVVMHGPGLGLLRNAKGDHALKAAIDDLKLQNVQFVVCNFTLQRQNIPLSDLYDANAEDVVPSGVAEVAHLQTQGYSYVKP